MVFKLQSVTLRIQQTVKVTVTKQVVLKLTQTGIPEEAAYGNANAAEVALQGWRPQLWGRVRQCFGYGC